MTNPREKVRVGWLPAKLSFLLLFFCLQIQANVYSQQTRVSIKLDNVSVQQLFVEIERITDLAFVYNTKDVESLGVMDVDFENEEVETILDACLKDKGLVYSIVNNHIVVRKADPQVQAQAQQVEERLLTGKVLDKETGDPLPGATVMIKGTTIGSATDIDGKFSFSVATKVTSLVVSFIGYKTQEVPVGQRDDFIIALEPDAAEMEEVVVTGVFVRKQESYTGSARTMNKNDVNADGYAYYYETALTAAPKVTD